MAFAGCQNRIERDDQERCAMMVSVMLCSSCLLLSTVCCLAVFVVGGYLITKAG